MRVADNFLCSVDDHPLKSSPVSCPEMHQDTLDAGMLEATGCFSASLFFLSTLRKCSRCLSNNRRKAPRDTGSQEAFTCSLLLEGGAAYVPRLFPRRTLTAHWLVDFDIIFIYFICKWCADIFLVFIYVALYFP